MGAAPRGGVAAPWRLSVPTLDSVYVSVKNLSPLIFVQFREYFPTSFSETENSRKQELALWHLVNRLVLENA